MVFQQFNLWPHMTVQENVAAPLVLGKKMSRQAAKAAAMAALDRVGMAQKPMTGRCVCPVVSSSAQALPARWR
jgi:ABC-type polar amino acid transport system ATPase subunit